MLKGVGHRATNRMREFWDGRAQDNAAWYVDTSLSYDDPDMARFFATGELIVADALDDAPALPEGRAFAVEIGSGLGRVCRALAPRFDRVLGVDISPEMVERARQLVTEPNISFVLGDGESLGVTESGVADLVLSFTVFQHIPNVKVIEGYMREAGRILKPGGVLIMQWNNEPGHWQWRVRRTWLALLQRTRIRPERHQRHAPQFLGSRVPVATIERALRDGGLELCGTRNAGTLYTWGWARKASGSTGPRT